MLKRPATTHIEIMACVFESLCEAAALGCDLFSVADIACATGCDPEKVEQALWKDGLNIYHVPHPVGTLYQLTGTVTIPMRVGVIDI